MRIDVSFRELASIRIAVEQRERDFLLAYAEQNDPFLRDIDKALADDYRALAIRLQEYSMQGNAIPSDDG